MSNIYNHHDLSEMHLYPCAYSMTFNVSGGTLNGILNQRSQDMLTANSWNVCQYAVLMHMFAQASGLKVGELVHVIADAHIYDRHIPMVEELLKKEPLPGPNFVGRSNCERFLSVYNRQLQTGNYQYHPLTIKFLLLSDEVIPIQFPIAPKSPMHGISLCAARAWVLFCFLFVIVYG